MSGGFVCRFGFIDPLFNLCFEPVRACQDQYLLSLVVLRYEPLQLLCQGAVLLAQLGVAGAVLLDLGLDVAQRPLEVGGDLFPLQVVLSAPLQGLFLQCQGRT